MAKFELNEIVLCVKAGDPTDWDLGAEAYFGLECEILELCSSVCAWGPRHRVQFRDGVTVQLTEDFLRKRPQQDDNLFTEWYRAHIITDIRPTERQVREGLKGILQPFAGLGKVGER